MQLRKWGRTNVLDDAVVITGELFSNAFKHAPSSDYVLAIDWNGGMIRLEMWDSSSVRPTILPINFVSESGRGMRVVDALSELWGTRIAASGKCVWAILPLVPKNAAE